MKDNKWQLATHPNITRNFPSKPGKTKAFDTDRADVAQEGWNTADPRHRHTQLQKSYQLN